MAYPVDVVSLLVTALSIAAYGLLVHGFYQILSRRVLFARTVERVANQRVEEALEAAKAAADAEETAHGGTRGAEGSP